MAPAMAMATEAASKLTAVVTKTQMAAATAASAGRSSSACSSASAGGASLRLTSGQHGELLLPYDLLPTLPYYCLHEFRAGKADA